MGVSLRLVPVLCVAALFLSGCALTSPGCGPYGASGEIRFAKTVTAPNYCQVTATYTNREAATASVQLRVRVDDAGGQVVTEQPLLFSRVAAGQSKTTEIVDARICDAAAVSVPLAEKMSNRWSLRPGAAVCGVEGSRASLR